MADLPDRIVINGVTYVRQDQAADTECGRHECSYYNHYLVFWNPEANGPQLGHEAFHSAERRCLEVQNQLNDWMNAHPDSDPVLKAPHLWNQAEFWERKVAA